MARSLEDSLIVTIRELSRVFGEERVMNVLTSVVKGVAHAKATVDGNLQTALSLVNLPSKADVKRLETSLEGTRRTLMNLSKKVDRLLETQAAGDAPAPSPASADD